MKRFGLVLAGAILGLLASELLLRVGLAWKGTPYSASETQAYARELQGSALLSFGSTDASDSEGFQVPTQGLRLHPYLGFAHHDLEDRLRAAERVAPGRTLLVVGGSVAAGFGNHVAQHLGDAPPFDDQPLHVLSLATAGHKQPQQLHAVAHVLSLGHVPDLVLNLDGFNEVALGSDNGTVGLDVSQLSRGHWLGLATRAAGSSEALERAARLLQLTDRMRALAQSAERLGLFRSAVAGHHALFRIRRLRNSIAEQRALYLDATGEAELPEYLVGPRPERFESVRRSVRIWKDCSWTLDRLCKGLGIGYVHVLQPTLHDPGAKSATPEELRNGMLPEAWLSGVVEGYPQLREAAKVLQEQGVCVFDASRAFADIDTTLYVDGCHFDGDGYSLLATQLSEFLQVQVREGALAIGKSED